MITQVLRYICLLLLCSTVNGYIWSSEKVERSHPHEILYCPVGVVYPGDNMRWLPQTQCRQRCCLGFIDTKLYVGCDSCDGSANYFNPMPRYHRSASTSLPHFWSGLLILVTHFFCICL